MDSGHGDDPLSPADCKMLALVFAEALRPLATERHG